MESTKQLEKARYIVSIDYGNGSTKWAVLDVEIGKIIGSGSFPSLYLPTPAPGPWADHVIGVDGEIFACGAIAARMNLKAAHCPGRGGGSKAKDVNLHYVLAAVLCESGLASNDDDQPVNIGLRMATPVNCQVEAHQSIVGEHYVTPPKSQGQTGKLFNVLHAVSCQECKTLVAGDASAVVDLGNGTTYYGYLSASSPKVMVKLDNYESGVGDILEEAASSPTASDRLRKSVAGSQLKGVLSAEGLGAEIASGRAFKKNGSIEYKGVEFSDILKPLVLDYWERIVKKSIEIAATKAVPVDTSPKLFVVGGGAALLKKVLDAETLANHGIPAEMMKIVWPKNPQLELVKAMTRVADPVVE